MCMGLSASCCLIGHGLGLCVLIGCVRLILPERGPYAVLLWVCVVCSLF